MEKPPQATQGRGRPKLPSGKVRLRRATCWLDDDDKSAVDEASAKSGQSASDLLRAGLVVLGILPPRPPR